jgi:hypothetical protein
MELFGDLSSYNAAATLRVSSTLKGLDEVLYRTPDSGFTGFIKDNSGDARSRSIRNPLLLMFRQAAIFRRIWESHAASLLCYVVNFCFNLFSNPFQMQ